MAEPNALWVRFLKGLYFHQSSFLQATSGSRPSWAWASLLKGRSIIENEGVWALGNGQAIRPFRDPWVPLKDNFRIRPKDGVNLSDLDRVADWMDHEGRTWRDNIVRDLVNPSDVKVVLNITIPIEQGQDVLRWPHTRDGAITVRSAYHRVHGESSDFQVDLNRSPRPDMLLVWPAIWNAQVWPKYKAFMWKMANDVLPTKDNLRRRGLQLSPLCPSCQSVESREHLFFDCP